MASQHSSSSNLTLHGREDGKAEIVRRSAEFPPTMWGSYFLNYVEDQKQVEKWNERAKELKEEVRRMVGNVKDSLEKMNLIDALQRLGLEYHFEKEINKALQQLYDVSSDAPSPDLHATALWFRLLRQQGFYVPSDVFDKFKDDSGNFKSSLTTNIIGLLSLYEASHLSIEGEEILDEAITFTTEHLKSANKHQDSHLASLIEHAIDMPLHMRVQRLASRLYISIYEQDKSRNDVLLELAKLDYNLVQICYQIEVRDCSRWWKGIDLIGKLPFARDRLVEGWIWPLSIYYQPKYSRARSYLTKFLGLLSIIDDLYDAYGTLEELQQFTDAVDRWNLKAMDQLPDYTKVLYRALLDTVQQMEDELVLEGSSYRLHYVKKETKGLVKAYLAEAQWHNKGHIPTFDEYLGVAIASSGFTLCANIYYVGMLPGEPVGREIFEWLSTRPEIIIEAARHDRLIDDIGSHKFEQKRGHVASAVECYMNDHGATEEEAVAKLEEICRTCWKKINKACLKPTPFPKVILDPLVNTTRATEMIYQHGEDGYTFPKGRMNDRIRMLLVESFPL